MASQRTQLLGTLVGAILLAAAAGAYGWFGVWLPAEAEQAKAGHPARALELDPAAIIGLEVVVGEASTKLQKGDRGYRIIAPIEAPADEQALEGLLSALLALRPLRTVAEDGGDGAQFGLTPPAVRLVITSSTSQQELQLGARNDFDGSTFARVAGSPRVLSIDAKTRKALALELMALRDKRVVTAREGEVSTIALQSPANRWTLKRHGERGFRLDDALRADREAARSVLFALTDWRGTKVVEEQGDPAVFGIGAPDSPRFTLGLKDGRTIELSIGLVDGKAYVRPDGGRAIWEVSPGFLPKLDVPAEALVDHVALGFEKEAVRELRIEGGGEAFVVQRKPEGGFQLLQPRIAPLDPAKVQALLTALASLRSEEWPADDAAEAAARGLATPARTLTIFGAGGVQLERVELGGAADEARTWIRADGMKGRVGRVDRATLEKLPKDAAALEPAPAPAR